LLQGAMSPTYANLQYQMNETFDMTNVLLILCNYEKFDDCRMWLGQNQWKSKHLCRLESESLLQLFTILYLSSSCWSSQALTKCKRHYTTATELWWKINTFTYIYAYIHLWQCNAMLSTLV